MVKTRVVNGHDQHRSGCRQNAKLLRCVVAASVALANFALLPVVDAPVARLAEPQHAQKLVLSILRDEVNRLNAPDPNNLTPATNSDPDSSAIPTHAKSPTDTRRPPFIPLLFDRKLSAYSSSSICHIIFLRCLKRAPRYRDKANRKRVKNAKMRVRTPSFTFSSTSSVDVGDGGRNIARSMELLIWR